MSPLEAQEKTPRSVSSLAAETDQGADDKSRLPARIQRYSQARERAREMLDYTTQHGYVREAKNLSSCGEYLVFRYYYTIGKIRLHAAQFCKQHLLCPLCAIRRGAKALKAYLERYAAIRAAHLQLYPFMVTFTVKNGDDLAERFSHLRHNLQRLHKCRSRQRGVSEVEKAEAGVWSYEVTNKGNGWHPHVHAIWLCTSPPSAALLSQQWRHLTGDSFVVDVRPIAGDHVQGFLEVFKYAVKFSGLELADNWHAYKQLKGERLLASFGLFRGIEIPDDLEDDPISDEDLPYVELFFQYITGRGYTLSGKRGQVNHASPEALPALSDSSPVGY